MPSLRGRGLVGLSLKSREVAPAPSRIATAAARLPCASVRSAVSSIAARAAVRDDAGGWIGATGAAAWVGPDTVRAATCGAVVPGGRGRCRAGAIHASRGFGTGNAGNSDDARGARTMSGSFGLCAATTVRGEVSAGTAGLGCSWDRCHRHAPAPNRHTSASNNATAALVLCRRRRVAVFAPAAVPITSAEPGCCAMAVAAPAIDGLDEFVAVAQVACASVGGVATACVASARSSTSSSDVSAMLPSTKRPAGARETHRANHASKPCGRSPASPDLAARTSPSSAAIVVPGRYTAFQNNRPVSIQYASNPNGHTSVAVDTGSAFSCSGAIQREVPPVL